MTTADHSTADFERAARRLDYRIVTGRRSHVKIFAPDGRLATVLPSSRQREGKHRRTLRAELRRAGFHDLAALLA